MIKRTTRFTRTDWGVLFTTLMLVIIGLVMVYSASYGFALFEGGMYEGRPTHFVQRQVAYSLVGLAALLVAWRVDYRLYRKYAIYIFGLTFLVLFGMAVLGRLTGASDPTSTGRWLLVSQRSIQPSEIAKLGAMVYVAAWLEAKSDDIRNRELRYLKRGLVPFAILIGIIAGLVVAQPDFSTAALLVATAMAMFFVAGVDAKQFLIGILVGGAALVAVAYLATYRSVRMRVFVEGPFSDPLGEGFQLVQALRALNAGGLFGVGLGQSAAKFTLYAPHSDCIFAIIAEETGLVGAVLVMAAYGLWTWRGLRVARHAPDAYGSLLAVGIVVWVTLQAALHIGVLTASTPFTGTVLPFISYGGSSLVSLLASVGILLNISRASRAPQGAA